MKKYLEPGSLTRYQAEKLECLLPEGTPISHLSCYQAAAMIKLHDPTAAWRQEPASDRQKQFLERRGLWREGLTKGEASDLIEKEIAKRRIYSCSLLRMPEE